MRGGQSRLVGAVRRRPLLAFLLWLVTVGWAIGLTPVVVESAWDTELPFQPFAIATTVFGALLPALVIAYLSEGGPGLRDLWARVSNVRLSFGWYAIALLALPVPALVLAVIFLGPPDATASAIVSAALAGLLLQGAIAFVTINFIEEIAWMGFFQARVQSSHGPARAAVYAAAGFTLMHVPLFVANEAPVALVLPLFFIMSIGFRALIGWVYNSTASLFLVGVLHAAGNAATGGSGFGEGFLARLYDSQWISVLHTVAAFAIGIGLIVATRGRLGASDNEPRRPRSLLVQLPDAAKSDAAA
jgi:membrane protease YdiL (CAAX protease family)